MSAVSPVRPLRVTLLHPELGVGGAERFVLDAAKALSARGHRVSLCAARLDPGHAFSEATDGSIATSIAAPWLPLRVLGGLQAPLGIAALCAAGLQARLSASRPDLVLVDSTSAAVPLLRAMGHRRILYYGHFPDLLLGSHHGWRRQAYRKPLDWLEGYGLTRADRVLVNSHFTLREFRRVFPGVQLGAENVLHPAIDDALFASVPPLDASEDAPFEILALGRFVSEKRHADVLEAFLRLRESLSPRERSRLRLTLAGAVDERLPEQRRAVARLRARSAEAGTEDSVQIEVSIDDQRKLELFQRASVLVYPPINEHFGLVPLEAMASARPVIAMNSGGPKETVRDGHTGRLVEPTVGALATAVLELYRDRPKARAWGLTARAVAREKFSFHHFSERLNHHVTEIVREARHEG